MRIKKNKEDDLWRSPYTLDEHDSCALIANIRKTGIASHGNVKRTLQALARMGHRTGEVDGEGDGCGVLTDIPRRLWAGYLEQLGYPGALAEARRFFVGHILIPASERPQAPSIQEAIHRHLTAMGCDILIARAGPVRSSALGKEGRRTEPLLWQVAGLVRTGDPTMVDSCLFEAHMTLERHLPIHVASLSAHSVVYKVRGSVEVLGHYFPELRHPDYASVITIGHSRYSTNTWSIFERVQPFSMLAHNGEINTITRLCQEAEMLGTQLVTGGSDSQQVNRLLETLIYRHGLSPLEALEMIFPPVPSEVAAMPPSVQQLYTYYRYALGPLAQGPAAIIARAGDVCMISVDALGLRPLWFGETEKEYFVSSEKGAIPLEEMTRDPKPLAPGEHMALRVLRGRGIDVLTHQQIQNECLVTTSSRLGTNPTVGTVRPITAQPAPPVTFPLVRRAAFGWGRDDVEYLEHLAATGSEPIGSLGYDGPLAALSSERQNLADYFKESVAVVTNPSIDREREMEHFSTEVIIGQRPSLTDVHKRGCLVTLRIPFLLGGGGARGNLSPEEERAIASGMGTMLWEDMVAVWEQEGAIASFPLAYPAEQTIQEAIAALEKAAVAAVQRGACLIALDDEAAVQAGMLWIDPHVAIAAVDRALRRAPAEPNLRRHASIIVRSGGIRNLHDLALALGFGAEAVCPYLIWELATAEGEVGTRLKNLVRALSTGLEKVISTMGIHELRGYGRIFSSIGLSASLAGLLGTPNYCGSDAAGLDWKRLDQDARERARVLSAGQGELTRTHHFYPPLWKTAAAVATGAAPYRALGDLIAQRERALPVSIRHIIDLRQDGHPSVDPSVVDTTIGRHAYPIVISGMSFGSQGEVAFRAYAEAAYRLNIVCLNGEGGEIPDMMGRYVHNRGQQVASGRFGVNAALLNSANILEIKIGQGAKPGEGGHLPGRKVSAKVAAARHTPQGIDLISPSNNHDLYSIEDLAQIIEELQTANPRARVSVKVPVVPGIGIIAVGIAKAGASIINLSGYDGGTGAARVHALKHVGLPAEIGVVEAHRALIAAGIRDRVEIWCDGGMKSAADVIKMICLGANRVGFGTMAMVAIGCTICRRCQTDTCHVGIATQLETPEEAAARGVRHFSPRDFEIAVENLCRFFKAMGEEIRVLTASLGAQRTQDLVGRGDLLIQARAHDRLDLRDLLTPVYMDKEPPLVAQRIVRRPRNYLTKTITDLVTNAVGMGDHIVSFFDDHLDATDRALGTHLAGELVRQIGADHAARQMQADVERVTLTFDSASVPGNGLAAFLSDPLRVVVEGGAQDGVAKGAMGGVVAILKGMNHHGERLDGSVGKSFAYGAQRGLFIVQGDADSRACIRLSGADVVFGGRIRERVDDQGGGLAARANLKGFAFEYMTAGRVLVLGDPGPWICAGMTGGVVYLRLQPELGFDVAAVQRRIARGAKVRLARVNLQDGEVIRSLLHAYATVLRESDQEGEAQQVEAMLIDWNERFIKVVPASQVVDQEISTE